MRYKPSKAAIEARREYMRIWRKNNPDKTKKHRLKYWEKRARLAAENEQREADDE